MRKKESFKENRLIFESPAEKNQGDLQNPANRESEPAPSENRREAMEDTAASLEERSERALAVLNEHSGDLNRMDQRSLETVVKLALLESATDSLIYRTVKGNLDATTTNSLNLETIKSILNESWVLDRELYEKVLDQLDYKKKAQLEKDASIQNGILLDIRDRLVARQETFQKKSNSRKMREAGISLVKGNAVFKVEGKTRSFIYGGARKSSIEKALAAARSTDEVRLIFYQNLLEIIEKDGSIRTNQKMRASNERLLADIAGFNARKNNNGKALSKEQLKQAKFEAESQFFKFYGKNKAAIESHLQVKLSLTAALTKDNWTFEQYTALRDSIEKMHTTIADGIDPESIIDNLRKIARKGYTRLQNSPITEAEINLGKQKIQWDLSFPDGDLANARKPILELKQKQLSSEEYKNFLERSKRSAVEIQTRETRKSDERAAKAEYETTYHDLTQEDYRFYIEGIDSEEKIKQNWKSFDGHKEVERIMQRYPFGLLDEIAVMGKAAKIITSGFKEMRFEDIFEHMDGFPAIKESEIPKELLTDNEDFLEKFNELKERESTLTDEEHELLKNMFELMAACLDLLKAISSMHYKNKEKIEETEFEPKDYEENAYTALYELTDYDLEDSNAWEEFYSYLFEEQHKTNITMVDINGKTFTVSQGAFKDRYSAKAALNILLDKPELTDYNEHGNPYLSEQKVRAYINEMIKLGGANMALAKADKENSAISPSNIATEVDALEVGEYDDLTDLSDEQKAAFQLGFIASETAKNSAQFKKAGEILEEDAELAKRNPFFKQITDRLIQEKIPAGDIRKIDQALVAAGGITVDTRTGSINGFGGGAKIINITEDINISAFGGGFQGDIVVGGKLQINVHRSDDSWASIEIPISLAGIGAGVSGGRRVDTINIDAFIGAQLSLADITPMAGFGVMISVNTQERLKQNLEEGYNASQFRDLWEAWKKIPKQDIEARYNALKNIAPVYASLAPLETAYSWTHADLVLIVESIQDKIKNEVFENTDSTLIPFIPLISHVGFIMLGPVPIPAVGIEILDTTISIPNRREIARITSQASSIRLEHQLKNAVAQLDNRESKLEKTFVEQTPKLIYSHDGKLLSLIDRYEVNLNSWLTTAESYNDALKKAGLKFTELANSAVELSLLPSLAKKNTEIFIDPELTELGVVVDGKHIFLEGNIDDLIVTRETFRLPFEVAEGVSNIREVITIRQKSSIKGDRDSYYMQRYSPTFLQKLADEEYFDVQKLNQHRSKSYNILEITGYSTSQFQEYINLRHREKLDHFEAAARMDVRGETFQQLEIGYQAIKPLLEHRPDKNLKITKADIAEAQQLFSERRIAIGNKDAYPETRPNLLGSITALYEDSKKSGTEFYTKLSRATSNTPKIIELLIEHGNRTLGLNDLSEEELQLGVTHLLNLWYTDIYGEAYTKADKKTAKEVTYKKLNAELIEAINQRINFLQDNVFIPAFQKAINRMSPKPGITAQRAAEILIRDTDGQLKAAIRKNLRTFDYTKLTTAEIPENAYFFSGSRTGEDRERKGALTGTINYKNIANEKTSADLNLGFLQNTLKNYSLTSTNKEEKAMARLLLEVTSPLPQNDLEFLYSPLAIKIASLKSHMLLMYTDSWKFEDYRDISRIYADPAILQTDVQAADTFPRFRKLVEDIRKAQVNGQTFEKPVGSTGLVVRIKMNTDIAAGSYSKCANPSFYTVEEGQVEVLRDSKVIARFEMSNEIIDTELSKIFRSIGVGVGLAPSETPALPKGKPAPEGQVGGEAITENRPQGGGMPGARRLN